MIEPPRIAVVGAGFIGAGVAPALAERGRDVLLLDRGEARLGRVAERLGAMGKEVVVDDAPGFGINLHDAGLGDG